MRLGHASRYIISTWPDHYARDFRLRVAKKNSYLGGRGKILGRTFPISAKRVLFSPPSPPMFILASLTANQRRTYIKKKKRITSPFSAERRTSGYQKKGVRKGDNSLREGGGVDCKIDGAPSSSPTSSGSFYCKKSPVNFLRWLTLSVLRPSN